MYSIDIAVESDLPSIIDLVSTQYDHPITDPAFWQWRYFSNKVANVAIYVARNTHGNIVAMQPVSAYLTMVRGHPQRVHMLTGAITHPDHRRRGLFRGLVEHATSDLKRSSDFCLYTFPNETSVHGFRRFDKWHQREQLSIYVRLLRLTGTPSQMRPGLHSDETIGEKPNGSGEFSFHKSLDFKQDPGELLDKCFPNGSIYTLRDCTYLAWRYRDNPNAQYSIVQAYKFNLLAGYIVVKPADIFGYRMALIVDLVADSQRSARALLSIAARDARRANLQMMASLVGCYHPYRSAYLKSAFLPIPKQFLPRKFFLYTFPHLTEGNNLAREIEASSWYITWGDTDVV